MKKNARFLLIAAAALLVSFAFHTSAQAFALTCPSGYTGPRSLQEGCCFNLKASPPTTTLQYYEYQCEDGVAVGGATPVCSATPCGGSL
jgi:hypothetical protein